MIELRDIAFEYAEGEFGMRIDTLAVPDGGRVCWFGPSGSGKTTLLHIVAGILPPSKGRVEVCGIEVSSLTNAQRRDFRIANIGLVFQDFALLDYLNVEENILLSYRINRTLRLDADVRTRGRELATGLGLGDLLPRRPAQLSQGERQRVAVCRALVTQPKLILADEPTANLDPDNAMRVIDALDSYAAKHAATLIVVTHDNDVRARFEESMDVAASCAPGRAALAGDNAHA